MSEALLPEKGTNKIFKEMLTALSLANILFAGSWRMYLFPPTFDYHIKVGPGRMDLLGIVFAVIFTGAVFFGAFRLFRKFYKEKADLLINFAFVTVFLLAVNICRIQLSYSPALTFPLAVSFQALFFGLLAVTFTRWREKVFNFSKTLTLLLAPFILITFSQALWKIVNYDSTEIDNELSVAAQLEAIAPKSKEQIKNRVVWIVFDEFDYRIAFDKKSVALPEFERLKNTSLSAENVESPARNTLEAIPSLLTGKNILKSVPQAENELMLHFADGSRGKFSETASVFSEVKALGGETAVDGFYHSYCRVLGRQLSVCKWIDEQFVQNETLAFSVLNHFNDLYTQFALVFANDEVQLKQTFDSNLEADNWHIREFIEDRSARLADAYRIATDPKIDLAFIHLPIPHPSARFNRKADKNNIEAQNYFNNLVLADTVMGEIRRQMEAEGQWDNSTVIVSSDHSLRVTMWKESGFDLTDNLYNPTRENEDLRIPFFLKLRDQTAPLSTEKPFNSVITHDLILGLMRGEIKTPAEARDWLEKAGNR